MFLGTLDKDSDLVAALELLGKPDRAWLVAFARDIRLAQHIRQ